MKFLVDAQLPPALARAITVEGHEAVHVCDIALTSASDRAVWDEALRRRAVVITKDEDFILIGRACKTDVAPPVVWIRIGNCSKKALLEAFLPILPTIVRLVDGGEMVVEVR
ncbi:DUF5615 family PIN-like protein [Nocardia vermiculata]|uniref:DUF5615 family PIN-like protein n=1 Tax=Nocardia vermiculata TaxID=257274 RepID=A0A846XRY0_9NOCA|nr:DUF5615 family PIN-like protein [Nocardia vermiculata]NKY48640.1 DUF5615 family PIN-like protein [Nocardia vermiculata]